MTDASGSRFALGGAATVSELKSAILQHVGIPIEKQRLRRITDGPPAPDAVTSELADDATLSGSEELQLLVADTNGGCEVS